MERFMGIPVGGTTRSGLAGGKGDTTKRGRETEKTHSLLLELAEGQQVLFAVRLPLGDPLLRTPQAECDMKRCVDP
eukprot:1749976-Pyramimonas_sp.AAC.2